MTFLLDFRNEEEKQKGRRRVSTKDRFPVEDRSAAVGDEIEARLSVPCVEEPPNLQQIS